MTHFKELSHEVIFHIITMVSLGGNFRDIMIIGLVLHMGPIQFSTFLWCMCKEWEPWGTIYKSDGKIVCGIEFDGYGLLDMASSYGHFGACYMYDILLI